jgi:hypothetical protein
MRLLEEMADLNICKPPAVWARANTLQALDELPGRQLSDRSGQLLANSLKGTGHPQ